MYVGCIVCKLRTEEYKGLYEGFEIFSKSEERRERERKKNDYLSSSFKLVQKRKYSIRKRNDGRKKQRRKKGRRIMKDRKEEKR